MNVAANVSTPPTIDASTTCPGRILYIHNPTSSAMGIVHAMVNIPHEEPGTRRTAPSGNENACAFSSFAERNVGAEISRGDFSVNPSTNSISPPLHAIFVPDGMRY